VEALKSLCLDLKHLKIAEFGLRDLKIVFENVKSKKRTMSLVRLKELSLEALKSLCLDLKHMKIVKFELKDVKSLKFELKNLKIVEVAQYQQSDW